MLLVIKEVGRRRGEAAGKCSEVDPKCTQRGLCDVQE